LARKRAQDGTCLYCAAQADNAEHTIFVCPHWEENGRQLRTRLGRSIEPEDVQPILCGPTNGELPDDYRCAGRVLEEAARTRTMFMEMIQSIMETKEADERLHQAAGVT